MSKYEIGKTIERTLDEIHRNDLVLPAIQREFVWKPDQICRLFDSLMQGFPFGTFLYWDVARKNCGKFRYFGFVREYHERDNPHCPGLGEIRDRRLTLVLDGQQRLTAFNVGLRGSLAVKLKYKWRKSADAYPKRHLFLDLLSGSRKDADEGAPRKDADEGAAYRFSFRRENDREGFVEDAAGTAQCWFRVSDILGMDGGPPMLKWLTEHLEQHWLENAYYTLDTLYRRVRQETPMSYYVVDEQSLDKVVQIFIRMNDGGTKLSHSDLLLSIAVAQWKHLDARAAILNLVDDLNRIVPGFDFSKDLILRAGLMLSDIASVKFKVDNFNRENMAVLEREWSSVKSTLYLTVELIAGFGFDGDRLTANSAVLPIAYYLHREEHGKDFLGSSRYRADRKAIRGWLIRSLIKSGVWRSVDSLLQALRKVIRSSTSQGFPAAELGEKMGGLTFAEEEIEELADTESKKGRAFALLSLIFPDVNPDVPLEVDHIFPATRFTTAKLRDAGIPEDKIYDFRDRVNRLGNLQLLSAAMNKSKGATMPAEWLAEEFDDQSHHIEKHLLGSVPSRMADFIEFYEARRNRLVGQLKQKLG